MMDSHLNIQLLTAAATISAVYLAFRIVGITLPVVGTLFDAIPYGGGATSAIIVILITGLTLLVITNVQVYVMCTLILSIEIF